MNTPLWWTNLLAYSAQVAALTVVGALLPFLLRIRFPRPQLWYYQALLAVCLLLPVAQPWRRPVITAFRPPAVVTTGSTPVPSAPARHVMRWDEIALAALAAGAAIRTLWLALGLWRLRRYRLDSDLMYPLSDAVEAARARVAAGATVAVSEEIGGPVTFGVLRPIILLPARFGDLPYEAQYAVACHEFLHVRRRDWLVTVLEEAVAIVLWFHPAVWWLLARIRLTREQVVDREVVSLTEAGRPYVDALLAMAGCRPQLDLAPAPLFLRKRHLAQRLQTLLQETSMSKLRLITSYAFIALVLAMTGWFTLSSFPLQGTPEVKTAPGFDPSGITVDPGGKILHRPPVNYSLSTKEKGIQGVVVLELTLEANGTVADARVISGPQELRKDALASVLQWHYEADGVSTRRASIDFRTPPGSPQPIVTTPDEAAIVIRTLDKIDCSGLPEPLPGILQPRLAPYEGRPFTMALMKEIISIAREAEPHVEPAMTFRRVQETGTESVSLTLRVSSGSEIQGGSMPARRTTRVGGNAQAALLEPGADRLPLRLGLPGTESPGSSTSAQRIRVGGNVQSRMLVSQARPVYPPDAKEARIQGTVKLNAVLDVDGHVRELTVESGHPLLVPATLEAVRKWVYRPTLLDGKPVEVATTIDVNFTLATSPFPRE